MELQQYVGFVICFKLVNFSNSAVSYLCRNAVFFTRQLTSVSSIGQLTKVQQQGSLYRNVLHHSKPVPTGRVDNSKFVYMSTLGQTSLEYFFFGSTDHIQGLFSRKIDTRTLKRKRNTWDSLEQYYLYVLWTYLNLNTVSKPPSLASKLTLSSQMVIDLKETIITLNCNEIILVSWTHMGSSEIRHMERMMHIVIKLAKD